jgi:hypothetical protein
MTPRTLLTTIGATAVAFALAIGIAAGSADTLSIPDSAASTTTVAYVAAGTELAGQTPAGIARQFTVQGDDCPIAV